MNAGRLDRFPIFVKWLSLLMLIALSVGCARTLRFKVIDAASNRPVEGVEVQWFTSLTWLKIYKTNLVVAGYTDKDGAIEIDGVKRGQMHGNTFVFSKHDYQGASVVMLPITNAVAIISPDNASASETNRAFVSLKDRKAEITVPLHAR